MRWPNLVKRARYKWFANCKGQNSRFASIISGSIFYLIQTI